MIEPESVQEKKKLEKTEMLNLLILVLSFVTGITVVVAGVMVFNSLLIK
jgi:hypothetical protein